MEQFKYFNFLVKNLLREEQLAEQFGYSKKVKKTAKRTPCINIVRNLQVNKCASNLLFEVWDKDRLSRDDLIGKVSVLFVRLFGNMSHALHCIICRAKKI